MTPPTPCQEKRDTMGGPLLDVGLGMLGAVILLVGLKGPPHCIPLQARKREILHVCVLGKEGGN